MSKAGESLLLDSSVIVFGFKSHPAVAGCGLAYGAVLRKSIRRMLEEKGRPIPENDIWIAALALQHGLRLFARDQHFNEIEGLNVLQLND